MKVLLVEDERELAETLARGLRRQGMVVNVVRDGEDALDRAEVARYDVVVLDRNLPGLSGDAVCRALDAVAARARAPGPAATGCRDSPVG